MTTIIAVNDTSAMVAQLRILLESFQEHNFPYPVHILVYLENKTLCHEWTQLKDYNCKIFPYKATQQVIDDVKSYTNIHRVFSLINHYEAHPELENQPILYLDADIMLTRPLDIEGLLNDDICYGSDITHYSNYTYYFETKQGQVKAELLQTYIEQDPVGDMIRECGLDPQVMKAFNDQTAGVHYLLKGFTKESWQRVYKNTLYIHRQLDLINQTFMIGDTYQEKDDKGFQKYCADILATHIEIWSSGKETKIDKELNFVWPREEIEKWDRYPWFHNAGVSPNEEWFWKGRYTFIKAQPYYPFEAHYVDGKMANEKVQKSCQYNYLKQITKIREKYYV